MIAGRRPHPVLLVVLALTVLYGSVTAWRSAHRPPGQWVGVTHCSWIGKPVVELRSGLNAIDSVAASAHESVHVAECARLGPVRYRWNTLFASSNLNLETPAYCAGERTRIRSPRDSSYARQAVIDNMLSAMADRVDSATIVAALRRECPELIPQ